MNWNISIKRGHLSSERETPHMISSPVDRSCAKACQTTARVEVWLSKEIMMQLSVDVPSTNCETIHTFI